ncbi:MAG: DUF1330 domain-containing protein [Leptospirales bacterium]|jgi:uncharacterized protein (DUF1330 family)
MAYESLIGLDVTDESRYQSYREAMLPILSRCGGGFRYDFRVGEVLKSETDSKINRLFLIHFPDRATKASFFADPEYLAARQKFFEPAVKAVTILSEYER